MRPADLLGRRFGRLIVLTRDTSRQRMHWDCVCDCGARKSVATASLTRGLTTSCWCYRSEVLARERPLMRKHGLHKERLYNLFMQIKYRCTNPSCTSYENYGGRGIECRFTGPEQFVKWALRNGYRRGLTIDRRDNDGHYSASNCRWVNMKTQQRNRSNNRILTIAGVSLCMSEWAELASISPQTLKSRLRKGWHQQQAVMTPLDQQRSRASKCRA